MNRELIFFIAYEACSGRDFGLWKKSPLQFINAQRLIGTNVFLHILELILLLVKKGAVQPQHLTIVHYFLFLGGFLVTIYTIKLLFTKRILVRGRQEYQGSSFEHRSKLLAFGYLILNFILLGIVYQRHI